MADLITITSSVLPDSTRVAAFRGVEAMSRPYEIEVFLIVEGEELDLGDAIGAKAHLTIDRAKDGLPPFHFAGVFAVVELLHELDGRSLVRAMLVPKLWLLGLSKHSRIFTKASIVDVITTILEDNGLSGPDFELRLGSYPTEEHVCQYRESDLAFISRWMEREGIFYFFEHSEDGEKLVLADEASYDPDPVGAPVRYHPQLGDDGSAGASFRVFRSRHATLPAMVKLKDYDYAKPSLDVSGSAKVSDSGAGEVSLYGERFFSPGDGNRLAKLRAEELLARQVVFHGECTRFHLRPGYTFELEDHPRDAFNVEYLTIEARHSGNQAAQFPNFQKIADLAHKDTYFVELEAIPAKTQFRAQSVTPWPRIYGFENGIVDGPAESEYAQIDEQGRYAVKFKFDESDLKNGGASTFVRMMQPHGGGVEGFHFPLRKATEVVFSFLGGDPDRPVISGVVPNALTPSPVTSGNHTKNVIQTGGRNRLEIEDQSDQQRITLSTPYSNTYLRMGSPNDGHELIVHTEDNTWLNAGKNLFIDAGIAPKPGGFFQLRVQDKFHTFVEKGDYFLIVKDNDFTTHVQKDIEFQTKAGNYELFVDQGYSYAKVKKDQTIEVESGNTKIDTKTGKTEILSKDLVKVESSNATMDLLAKDKITMKSSANDVYIEGTNVTTKSRSTTKHHILGDEFTDTDGNSNKYVHGMSKTITVGVTQSVFFGISNAFKLSGELSHAMGLTHGVFVGGKSAVFVGLSSDITVAGKFSIEASISYKMNAAVTFEMKLIDLKQENSRLKQRLLDLEFGGFKLVC